MNKKRTIFVVLLSILVLLVFSISMIKFFMDRNQIDEYDFVFGVYIFRDPFRSDHILYGYKDGNLIKLDNKYKGDKSNIYRIARTEELTTYFDYATWNLLVNDMGGVTETSSENGWIIDNDDSVEKIKRYHEKYDYDIGDKTAFDNMINYINEKNVGNYFYRIRYFFITNNNYYIVVTDDAKNVMYQYDNQNKTVHELFEFVGDIEYFKYFD